MSTEKKSYPTLTSVCFALSIFIFILVGTYTTTTKVASAQLFGGGGVVTVIGGAGSAAEIQNALTNSLSQVLSQTLNNKELIYDPLAFNLAQQALEQQTQEILNWVNSGFDGDPAFITNFELYFAEGRDDVFVDIVYEGGLDNLCEPFQHEVKMNLIRTYQEQNYAAPAEKMTCPLDEYSGDTKAFLSGDFSEGGFDALFEIAFHSGNTSISAEFKAQEDIAEATAERKDNDRLEAEVGRGFRSMKVCENVQTPNGIEEKCTITKPGALIEEATAFQLTVPTRSLIGADEMNEILGSLFGNLATQAFTGINGLLGLGGNDSFTDTSFGINANISYLDAMREENIRSEANETTLNKAFADAQLILEYQLEIVSMIDELEQTFQQAQEENESCFDLTFSEGLTEEREELLQKIPVTIASITALQILVQDFPTATTAERTNILQNFTEMILQGLIFDEANIIAIETKLNQEITPAVEDFSEEIENEINACN